MSKPHPDFAAILAVIQPLRAHSARITGAWYRCTDTKFAHDLLSGKGSQEFGGRWNAPGSFPAVYLSDTPETALNEFLARSRRMRIRDAKSLPLVMAAVQVKLACILDLCAPAPFAAVGALLQSEKSHWRSFQHRREAITQAVGRAAKTAGFQGLRAPSQQTPNAPNLIVFPEALGRGDVLSAPKFEKIEWT